MPDDTQDGPAAQIAWGQRYIKDRYGTKDQAPEDVEVTCAGGIALPPIGVSDNQE